jgi:hypothetical protein
VCEKAAKVLFFSLSSITKCNKKREGDSSSPLNGKTGTKDRDREKRISRTAATVRVEGYALIDVAEGKRCRYRDFSKRGALC